MSPPIRTLRRRMAACASLVLLALSLTGCVKLDMDVKVNADDTVDGTVIFAVDKSVIESLKAMGHDPSSQLAAKDLYPSSAHAVSKPYDDGTYRGSIVTFTHAPLSDFSNNKTDALKITKSDGKYHVSGKLGFAAADLDSADKLPGLDRSDATKRPHIRLKLTFPGRVTSSNGTIDGNSVTWTPKLGEDTEITATAEPANPILTLLHNPFVLGGIGFGVVVLVALIAAFLVVRSRRATELPTPMMVGAPAIAEPDRSWPAPTGLPSDAGAPPA